MKVRHVCLYPPCDTATPSASMYCSRECQVADRERQQSNAVTQVPQSVVLPSRPAYNRKRGEDNRT
jgi:predicted nucleic acid-binding Zn ribbon protein